MKIQSIKYTVQSPLLAEVRNVLLPGTHLFWRSTFFEKMPKHTSTLRNKSLAAQD